MEQKQINEMAEALRKQGLTWNQTNFALSLVRNAVAAEREMRHRIREEPASSAERPLPEKWELGMRVRFLRQI